MDLDKVTVILNMPPPTSVKKLRSTLGHTGYYRRFNQNYVSITMPLENLLKKLEMFLWSIECDFAFDTIKVKLVNARILVYPYWNKEFHVHINVSIIVLGAILLQPKDHNLDHPIYFASHKLSTKENNYTSTKREALSMVYSLKNFRHYLLGGPFKFFSDHSTLKYLVNNPVLEGRSYHWLFLFQFTFEVNAKSRRSNVGLDHLYLHVLWESRGSIDDQLSDAHLFRIEVVPDYR